MPERMTTVLRLTLCDPLALVALCGLAAALAVLGLLALVVEEVLRGNGGGVDGL